MYDLQPVFSGQDFRNPVALRRSGQGDGDDGGGWTAGIEEKLEHVEGIEDQLEGIKDAVEELND